MNGLTTAPAKKSNGVVRDRPRTEVVLDAAAHGLDQPEDQHRIQIVHRLGLAGEAVLLGVAGQRQNVLHPHPRQRVQAALEEGTVPVLAREVSDGRQAVLQDVGDEGLRRESRVAARQVRDADDLDAVRRAGRRP